MMSNQEQLTDNDLSPGESCPECGEQITTWSARQVVNPEDINDDNTCWLYTDNVEPTGLTTSFAGNIIIIGHA